MGFEAGIVNQAWKLSGNKSLEGLIEWIEKKQDSEISNS